MSDNAQITVRPHDAKSRGVFDVTVREGRSETRHRVTVSDADLARFGGGRDAAALLEESFRFLLEREPKEAILGRFELNLIASYFSEYPGEILRRLGGI